MLNESFFHDRRTHSKQSFARDKFDASERWLGVFRPYLNQPYVNRRRNRANYLVSCRHGWLSYFNTSYCPCPSFSYKYRPVGHSVAHSDIARESHETDRSCLWKLIDFPDRASFKDEDNFRRYLPFGRRGKYWTYILGHFAVFLQLLGH